MAKKRIPCIWCGVGVIAGFIKRHHAHCKKRKICTDPTGKKRLRHEPIHELGQACRCKNCGKEIVPYVR